MKNIFILLVTLVLLGSCASKPEFQQGMTEKKFLRQNKEAVLSGIDGNLKTYRVNRGERFYVLATFENGKLIKLEEKETAPGWPSNEATGNKPDGIRLNETIFP
ncbi:hypothetical protein [Shivajiella indica]|uniref:Uncharacterized protein n=1 Tax=Shivajiella indica TaxID=872115 RepID=A0ABW5BCW0_9BACT